GEGQRGGEGTVNYSNEPNMQAAHLFNYAGRPWLSQYWVRRAQQQAYGAVDAVGGYGYGDEDQGQMGSLSALMSIGLFSLRGGCENPPIYDITTPHFDTVTIKLDPKYYPAKEFVIKTYNNSTTNHYIQSAKLAGVPLNNCWIYHRDLAAGKTLELWLGPKPNTNWGVAVSPVNSSSSSQPMRPLEKREGGRDGSGNLK
ncbi:MAG: glycoside hydrolase family 92 protein, partial [Verrucomicrobia bacterium]|nr:glycoside hydrolase family 92 protein [Verrucomicrobiota bacterium]